MKQKFSKYGLGTSVRDVTRQQIADKAKAKKCKVVEPHPTELQLDIDNEERMKQLEEMLPFLARMSPLNVVRVPSKSKKPGRYHVTITTTRHWTPGERIAMQAILGSDPVREMLSFFRLVLGSPSPTVFFEAL